MIQLTNPAGQRLPIAYDISQPDYGSVVLVEGPFGTAWQRHFADGLWYSTTGSRGRGWGHLLQQSRTILVYDAPRRPDHREEGVAAHG